MIFKTLIALAGTFGLTQLLRKINSFAKTIIVIQLIAILLTFIPSSPFVLIGWIVFIIAIFLAIIYSFKNDKSGKRLIINLICLPVFFANLFTLQHWPFASVFSLSCMICLIAFISKPLTQSKKYKAEIGFLTIIVIDGLVRFSMAVKGFFE
jgi:uncharacterized membrane protein